MSTDTCKTCPTFFDRSNIQMQEKIYGTPLNVPACPRMGMLLGTNSMSQEQEAELQAEVGSKCSKLNQPIKNGERSFISLSIGVGVPSEDSIEDAKVRSCRSCHFYVSSSKMDKEIGVKLGMCGKFGKLIPHTQTTEIATNCRASAKLSVPAGMTPEQHQDSIMSKVRIDPVLRKYIDLGDIIESSLEMPVVETPDPSVYPTDMPVSDAHKSKGIRAWRKMTRGNKEVYLPIFDIEFFDENERSKIPRTGDDEHPEQYMDHLDLAFTTAVLWRELDETPALHGVAGTGKTEFFRYMAWLMCLPFERISITRSTELDDLAGKTHFESRVVKEATATEPAVVQGETIFKQGRIPRAWAKPCVIVLDEPNVGSPDVWQFVRPLTDNSKQLVLDMNEGEVVKRNDHAYLGMAMNPAWDMRNIGAEVISDADGSRLMHIFVSLPDAKMEKKIIRDRCALDGYDIEDELLNVIMRIATDLRALADDQTLPITWGIRNQIKVARATRWFDLRQSYLLASADYLEPSVRDMILDTVKNHKA
jgi:MoxR-like ATPase